jgi:hypothetical protein
MIIFVLAFTAAVTFLTVTDNAPDINKKTSQELYREGIGTKK